MGEKLQFTELDQYLFGQGTHYDVYRKLGVHSRQAIIDLFEMHVKNEGLHVVFQRNAR